VSNTHKADILIVDDEANTLGSLSRAFRLAGHEATVCDNATRALDLARAQRSRSLERRIVSGVGSGEVGSGWPLAR